MENLTRRCACGAEISNWRSCPSKGCSYETVFCSKCGGDDKAVADMVKHIASCPNAQKA